MRYLSLLSFFVTLTISFAAHAATTTVDNNTAGYKSNSAWHKVTTGQIIGPDQQIHAGLAGATVIDNSSPAFSTPGGVWTTGTTLPMTVGANYAVAPYYSNPATTRIPTIVIDNDTYAADAGSTYGCSGGGNATSTTGSGYFGMDYQLLTPKLGYTNCRYQTLLSFSGNWGGTASVTLYAHWPSMPGLASNAKVTVESATGSVIASFVVNQQVGSGEWSPIGSFSSGLGTIYVVFDATNANGNVVADAIKLAPSDVANEPTARWNLPNVAGTYDIYAHSPASPSSEASPAMIVVGAAGSQRAFNYNPRAAMGQWQYIGTVDLSGTQPNYVLMQQWYATGDMLADAIAYAPAGTFPIASWADTASSPRASGQVKVSATWGADSTRTHRAVYAINYATKSGLSCLPANNIVSVVDQTTVGTSFPLATINIDPACPGVSVTLTPDATNGTLSADAIQITHP